MDNVKMSKDARIRMEIDRLQKQFTAIEDRQKNIVQGLIERSAFYRVNLEDMEDDIKINGLTEMFQQSKAVPPYERKRPIVDLYNAMTTSYQKSIKQLTDLIRQDKKVEKSPDDEFEEFAKGVR